MEVGNQENQNKEFEIGDYFFAAPGILQDMVFSDDVRNAVNKIGDAANLSEEQIDYLDNEVVFVLLGLAQRDTFKENVAEATGLSGETLNTVAKNINESIFNDVSDALKDAYTIGTDEEAFGERTQTTPDLPLQDKKIQKPITAPRFFDDTKSDIENYLDKLEHTAESTSHVPIEKVGGAGQDTRTLPGSDIEIPVENKTSEEERQETDLERKLRRIKDDVGKISDDPYRT